MLPHIEERQGIDIDPHIAQRHRNRLRIAPRRLDRAGRSNLIQPVKHRTRRKGRPERRLHPRNPSALLIDHDKDIVPAVQRTQCIGQRPKLVTAFHIALEDYVARRLGIAKQRAFVRGKRQARQAEDDRFHGYCMRR